MCRGARDATLWNVTMSDAPPGEGQDAPPGEGFAASQLSAGWWTRALAAHERVAVQPASRPAWAGVVEEAVAAAAPPAGPSPEDWPELLAIPLRPFLAGVRDRVAAAAGQLAPGHAGPRQLADAYVAAGGRHLARIARRTLEFELEVAAAASG